MPTQAAQLAARLLAYTPSSSVTDGLVTLAGTTLNANMTLAHAPSDELVTRTAKLGAGPAAAMAGAPLTDPDLLAALGGSSSRRTRRAVAGNAATPQDVLKAIGVRAAREDDDETLKRLVNTLAPDEWLDTTTHIAAQSCPEEFLGHLERVGDRELVKRCYRRAVIDNRAAIVSWILRNAPFRLDIPASELLALTPASAREDPRLWGVLLEAAIASGELDDVLVDLVVAEDRDSARRISTRAMSDLPRMSAYAKSQFLASGRSDLAEAVIKAARHRAARLTRDELAELVARGDVNIATELLYVKRLRRRLTSAQLEQVTADALPHSRRVWSIFECDRTQLPAAARLNLLRQGNFELTEAWLTGQTRYAPTVEEAAALAADPGTALDNPNGQAPGDITWLVRLVATSFTLESLTRPGVGDILDAAGVALVLEMVPISKASDPVLAYFASRVTERFGDDPTAWTTAVRLAAEMGTGTVTDLLDVVATLHTPAQAG